MPVALTKDETGERGAEEIIKAANDHAADVGHPAV
jgi:hypothetical protein